MNDFWNKLLPGSVKTDHGKFNGADLLIVVLNILLFGYTAYRSWRFLNGTFAGSDTTGEFAIAAIIALVGLDVAAVAWSIVWMFGSTTKWQDLVSLVMFIVSIIGMVLTSMTDTLSGEGNVPETLKIAAYYGVPAIILLNVAAGITYHMISPQVSLGRKERRLQATLFETQRLGEIAQQDTAMKLDLAEKRMKQNDTLIERQQKLAQQQMLLDGINLGITRAMSDDDVVKQRGQSVFDQLRNAVLPSTAPVIENAQPLHTGAPQVPFTPTASPLHDTTMPYGWVSAMRYLGHDDDEIFSMTKQNVLRRLRRYAEIENSDPAYIKNELRGFGVSDDKLATMSQSDAFDNLVSMRFARQYQDQLKAPPAQPDPLADATPAERELLAAILEKTRGAQYPKA